MRLAIMDFCQLDEAGNAVTWNAQVFYDGRNHFVVINGLGPESKYLREACFEIRYSMLSRERKEPFWFLQQPPDYEELVPAVYHQLVFHKPQVWEAHQADFLREPLIQGIPGDRLVRLIGEFVS